MALCIGKRRSLGYIGTAAITNYNTDGSLQVTMYFVGTVPTSAQQVELIVEP